MSLPGLMYGKVLCGKLPIGFGLPWLAAVCQNRSRSRGTQFSLILMPLSCSQMSALEPVAKSPVQTTMDILVEVLHKRTKELNIRV